MRNLVSMVAFQILIGIWLIVSPFVLGFRETTGLTTNNMIFGAIVLILGIGIAHYQKISPGIEHTAKKTT